MDALARRQRHAPGRVLPRTKKLDDAFGNFLVRVACPCGTSSPKRSRGSPGSR